MHTGNIKGQIKDAIGRLISAIENGQSEQLQMWLRAMGRFHRYSIGNQLLVSLQRPEATRIAGFHTWRKLGRQVRRGERAIRILAPIVRRRQREPKAVRRKQNRDNGDEEVVAFRNACVFDIAQTDGEDLPEFASVQGDAESHTVRLRQLRGIVIEHSNAIGPAQGFSTGGKIVLRENLRPAEEFSVLVHEMGHEILHYGKDAKSRNKTVRETEAEAVAFVVCEAVGLETNTAAVDYIQLYDGKKETLMESLERIQQTASEIIRGIQPDAKAAA